jgi:hypothetical protein
MTPARQSTPLDGMRGRPWIATTLRAARATASASPSENAASAPVDADVDMLFLYENVNDCVGVGRQ